MASVISLPVVVDLSIDLSVTLRMSRDNSTANTVVVTLHAYSRVIGDPFGKPTKWWLNDVVALENEFN